MNKWSVLVITISSVTGLVIIITGQDPYIAGKLIKFLFFSSLSLTLLGLFLSIKLLIKKFKK